MRQAQRRGGNNTNDAHAPPVAMSDEQYVAAHATQGPQAITDDSALGML